MNGEVLRERAVVVSRSNLPVAVVGGAVVAAVVVCVWPPVISGVDTSVPPLAGLASSLSAAALVAPVATFLSAVAFLGRDEDSGVGREYHLAGVPRSERVFCDVVLALAVGVTCVGVMAVGGLLFGVADSVRRGMVGPSAPPAPASMSWTGLLPLLLTVVAAALAVLLSMAGRWSTRRTSTVIFAVVASGVLLLAVSAGEAWRPLLLCHPLGGVWSLLYRGPSYRLRLNTPAPLAAASTLVWLAILSAFAWWQGRPQRSR
ncbi:hypothetical protein H9L10_15520 [Phycicoccus endophyticus]|uniref:Uncharacterized protein n=1 Tax=Phycicoccus endophyticus TaxID=1690220 RepID=A0A7G9R1S7_9MICO|nr:hypothetical protein [Phycicoccus endophyticus]NHI18650.1 hypothetical protein [Phycicoccus endophyticus]QNN49552.1 hypothetical protein H9L10_15520 [Phycicoccus endophyticus]GGL37507.1 hypothetical protein GCM10012283_20160 [Phycicoccus endophyticus]